MRLSREARRVLEEGAICYLAAEREGAPHLTPVVFALESGRVWLTTGRNTVKARLWEETPRAAGLVKHEGLAVAFRGRVRRYDALDPFTWPGAAVRAPLLVRASTRFTMKNFRYFAGYARDVYRVPLGWTPPGRIFVSVDLEDAALLDLRTGAVRERWGALGNRTSGRTGFRATRGKRLPDEKVPEEVRRLLERAGEGSLAVGGSRGTLVLPVRWVRAPADGVYYAALSRRFLALAGAGEQVAAALVIDHSSRWRAAKMRGIQLVGRGEVYVPDRMGSGRKSLLSRMRPAGELPDDPAVLRIRIDRAVWWRGWSSGTVTPG